MNWIKGLMLFLAGLVVGTVLMQANAAQQTMNTGMRIHHVGIAVKDRQQAVDYFTKVLGYRVAFNFPPDKDGKINTTFVQVSRDTFLEVGQASGDVKPGTITHIGIKTEDQKAVISKVRQAGGEATDSRPSGNTASNLANVTAIDGIRFELVEYTPNSLHKKAEDTWK
jgi:catechol 2,3-dioxygenase-like lactoylglutathione lyase family enzyme